MAAFDGIEVRLINPFVRLRGSRKAKLLSSLDELSRMNHRMHNKLFIADNVLALIGGRNIGDAYYMRAEEGENFIDLDALAAGAAVEQMSASFDDYWNSEFAWPIDRIVAPAADHEPMRHVRRGVAGFEMPAPDHGVPARLKGYATVPDELRSGTLRLTGARRKSSQIRWTSSRVRGSAIEKALCAPSSLAKVWARASNCHGLAVLRTRAIGIESLRQNRRNGVRMRMLTNSLASSDEPVVHAGYLEYRREMIEIGMEVYELSPMFAKLEQRLGRFGASSAALHMKAIVFDERPCSSDR